jgi:hypothetical protein
MTNMSDRFRHIMMHVSRLLFKLYTASFQPLSMTAFLTAGQVTYLVLQKEYASIPVAVLLPYPNLGYQCAHVVHEQQNIWWLIHSKNMVKYSNYVSQKVNNTPPVKKGGRKGQS